MTNVHKMSIEWECLPAKLFIFITTPTMIKNNTDSATLLRISCISVECEILRKSYKVRKKDAHLHVHSELPT